MKDAQDQFFITAVLHIRRGVVFPSHIQRAKSFTRYLPCGCGSMRAHIFGDSHGNYLFARTENADLHCIPGRTMHRVGRDGAADMLRQTQFEPDDVIIFVFGEVDVRCHMLRIAASKGLSLQTEADDLATRYVTALTDATNQFRHRPKICVMGIVPPIDPLVPNPILPNVGTLAERLVAWFLLDKALEARTHQAGYTFVPIPRVYHSRDGSLKRRYSDGHAHIAKDCTEAAARAVEKSLGISLGFRPLPVWRNMLRAATRQLAILNRDYAVLWTLGEANVDG
ncbi:hypothetical protein MKK75_30760 [Methylobacterium sp. J-030]|uniref:hypothetical protein n=1 Tax=Methylobacterium sp. J-030 TaxID=2836627 RepID=UPI001FBA8882|nr:hypothetical protein [Methylobacterium sp. J-030]MCJ2073115.1 hypothetical protein [Methylobacterium sp. J-030]